MKLRQTLSLVDDDIWCGRLAATTRNRAVTPGRAVMLGFSAVLVLLAGMRAGCAQSIDNGRRLSERWCSECHATGTDPAKHGKTISFASIAARPTITSDMIVSFLLMPHATMPNLPLNRGDAEDIAAFIIDMKK
jgi:mono/diheme cytochrome c family protein